MVNLTSQYEFNIKHDNAQRYTRKLIQFQLQFNRVLVTTLSITPGFYVESTLLPLEKHYILAIKGDLAKQQFQICFACV